MDRDSIPGWGGAVGPTSGYRGPHVYARDTTSGAGNCVCGLELGHSLHVQAAPGVDIPASMRHPAVRPLAEPALRLATLTVDWDHVNLGTVVELLCHEHASTVMTALHTLGLGVAATPARRPGVACARCGHTGEPSEWLSSVATPRPL